MTGQLYIDDADTYSSFGLYLVSGGYNDLLLIPPFKPLNSNKWQEYDGEEVDLSTPVLSGRTLSLTFGIADSRQLEPLRAALGGVNHVWRFSGLDVNKTLRLTAMSDIRTVRRLGLLTLTMAEDMPPALSTTTYPVGTSPLLPVQGVQIDGIDLSCYGIRVLQGTADTFRKWGDVKEWLKRDPASIAGILYDNEASTTYDSATGTLSLLLHAAPTAFLSRYYALYSTLCSAGIHTVYLTALNRTYNCYYLSSRVSTLAIGTDGTLWQQFSVALRLLGRPVAPSSGALSTEQSLQYATSVPSNDYLLPE